MVKSSRPSKDQKHSRSTKNPKNESTVRNSRTTVSGPAEPDASRSGDVGAEKAAATEDLASAFAFNPNKAAEYDPDAALTPPQGASVKPSDSIVGASTVTELNGSDKVGSGGPNIGQNPTVGPLDRVRVDSTDRALTTNQACRSATTRARSKRVFAGRPCSRTSSFARRSRTSTTSAFPSASCTREGRRHTATSNARKPLTEFTRASMFAEVGKQTPVFVRFSTVLGERGSTDTARDVRDSP